MSIEFLRKIRETEQEAENCVVNAREKAQKQQADASEQAMNIVKDAEEEATREKSSPSFLTIPAIRIEAKST